MTTFAPTLTPPRSLALAATTLLVAAASLGAQDDRENQTPVAAIWNTGASVTTIQNLRSQGWRLTNIEVQATSPMTFAYAMVANTGTHARSGSTWYYGTPAYVGSNLAGRRITDLEPYVINGEVNFAAVMEANTGSQAKGWAWGWGSLVDVLNMVGSRRIVDLDPFVIGSTTYYSVVAIDNTGDDNRTWQRGMNMTLSAIVAKCQAEGLRIYDIDRASASTFHVIFTRATGASGGKWWHYYGVTADQLTHTLQQTHSRIADLESYVSGSTRFFNAVVINNANALETRIGEILRQSDGTTGAYLKEVGGSVRASIMESFQFEPASTLKVLLHAHAMKQVQLGNAKLTDQVRVYTGTTGSCPQRTAPIYETLDVVLSKMMKNSDNNRTLAVQDHFGLSNIHGTRTALGMTRTAINHIIGCGGPVMNQLTLVDAGKLYEAVATGWLGGQRQKFYELMLQGNFNALVDEEAAKINLPSNVINYFKSQVERAAKGGSYSYDIGNGPQHFRTGCGWFQLPWRVNGNLMLKDYVHGVFVHDASDETKANTAASTAGTELLRDEIAAALATWKNAYLPGAFATIGTGCTGSNGTVNHYATGLPEIGNTPSYRLTGGAKSSAGVLQIGASKTVWGPFALPLSLTALGAPGCSIYNDPTIGLVVAINSSGTAGVSLSIPNDGDLVGKAFYSQFLCVDRTGNALGLTLSNGYQTTIGGIAW